MKKKLRMPVGIDNFQKLRQGYYFVDKTSFIRDLIDGHSEATLITRPRRFGKTLTLSMLHCFFTIENAEENRKLFDGCAISRAGEEYMAEQGTRPVVFLSLKDLKDRSFDLMLEHFAALMQSTYSSFRYLMEENLLYPEERDLFQSVLSRRASMADLQDSLKNLTQYLSRFHHRPVLLLIDEYDAPIQFAWDNDYYEDAISFFRNFLSAALKTNPCLDFAVMTGVLRIAKESIFSSLNNLDVSSVVSGIYADVMGFTRQEVEQMAADFGCPEKITEIRNWYDGYNFSGMEIYNPWSVINYFHRNLQPSLYWVNTSGNSILAELLKHASTAQVRDIHALMDRKSIYATLDEGVIYAELHENLAALYSVLLTTGYLTLDSRPDPYDGDSLYSMRIPNQEIRMLYKKEILRHMDRMVSRPNLMNEMLSGILSGETSKFAECLATYLESMASFHDTANRETFYHGLMLGLLAMLIPRYRVVSNRESGYGRFDIAVFPQQNQSPGILMEFKVAASEADLQKIAETALSQMENMDYMTEFRTQHITDIWQYGIAFYGKKCHIATKIH